MATVEFDMSEIREFFQGMERAAKGDFKRELELYLEGIAFDFLRVVHDEIVRRNVIDTRQLLHSFTKGDGGNVWELSEGGLTLEVGTNLDYAGYVNDGHWTNPKGVQRHWVPGHWNGDRFIYDPAAKTGMMWKQQWVEGAHYFEGALRAFEKTFRTSADELLQRWLERYFGA